MLSFTSFGRRVPSWPSIRFASSVASKSVTYESLKTCTTRRWLYNEDAQMALRTLNFDVDALGKVAAKATGASKWTDMKLIAEGRFNRVLGISLDNGQEVVARMPFPNAGPRRLMTSSEVATMDFLRTRLAAPVPKVLAWNASSDSDVGTEYIIMQKCPGRTLPLDKPTPASVVGAVAKIMTELAAISFSRYGSIYYKEDVDPSLQEWPLYADSELHDDCSEKFRIGPTVDRQFYRGGRAQLSIDRGPWMDALSYLKAVVDCEVKWIKTCSNTPTAKNQPGNFHTADDHLSVLEKWLQFVPAILPAHQYCLPTLLHPNNHAGDVLCFRDASTAPTCTIIDWQGASVRPLFEANVPQFISSNNNVVRVSESMAQALSLDTSDGSVNLAMKSFLEELGATSIALSSVLVLPHYRELRDMIYLSSRSWSEGLATFENLLIISVTQYGGSIPINDDYPICPLVFSKKDVAKNREEIINPYLFDNIAYLQIQSTLGRNKISLDLDGSVAAEDFEKAKAMVNSRTYHNILGAGTPGAGIKNEMQPIREGKYVCTMESCT